MAVTDSLATSPILLMFEELQVLHDTGAEPGQAKETPGIAGG